MQMACRGKNAEEVIKTLLSFGASKEQVSDDYKSVLQRWEATEAPPNVPGSPNSLREIQALKNALQKERERSAQLAQDLEQERERIIQISKDRDLLAQDLQQEQAKSARLEQERNQLMNERQHQMKLQKTYEHLNLRDQIPWGRMSVSIFSSLEFLGKGGYGLVMRASVEVNGKAHTVALKMITNMYEDATVAHVNRCRNEFEILSNTVQLHPNIVRQVGSFSSVPTEEMISNIHPSIKDLCYRRNGNLKSAQFFVLEHYENTLEAVISEGLTNAQAIKYSIHLARALLNLYESKIVHLDIKTDNLMVSSLDDLIVVDFGVAQKMNDDGCAVFAAGNPNHLSPEVYSAIRSNKAQIPCRKQHSWELGVVMYEMLSGGDHPFDCYPTLRDPSNFMVDVTGIPQEFHQILKQLLCPVANRISILDAWYYLETQFPGYA